ncbi:MAG: cysteine hydrolase family protein, partial [Vicinamibacterales bacterium]
MRTVTIQSSPRCYTFVVERTALLVTDMQRDFCSTGGYLDHSGVDIEILRRPIEPIRRVLAAARRAGLLVIFTREGHRPGLEDCPHTKLARTERMGNRIGKHGPLGRLLIRGSTGHGIVEELAPLPTETIIDKPGKGAFYSTELELILRTRGIASLLFTGVTTNVCVETTMREAADRGFDNLVLTDATGAINADVHNQAHHVSGRHL